MRLSEKDLHDIRIGDIVISCITNRIGVVTFVSDEPWKDCLVDHCDNDYWVVIDWGDKESTVLHCDLNKVEEYNLHLARKKGE